MCDIEGTLLQGGTAISGAANAIASARRTGLRVCFTTNTSTKPGSEMASILRANGIEAEPHDVVSTVDAALRFFEERPECSVVPVCEPSVAAQFAQFGSGGGSGEDYLILGDVGERFDHRLLCELAAKVESGRKLVTLSRNKLWYAQGVPRLDVGSYVRALEEATGVKAIDTGKPSSIFLNVALARLDVEPGRVLVVGDDPSTDIAGGASIGAVTALVANVKSALASRGNQGEGADFSITSIAELPELIESICA